MTYAMFSDDALHKFQTFCDAAGLTKPPSPQGAFDQALKPRKESTMSKFRYVPLKGCGNTLFTRERSNSMAFDEVSRVTEFADGILQYLHDKLSEQDLEQVRDMLKMEAGVKTDQQEESDKMIAGAKARGAQDSASARIGEAGFNSRFPSARKIGRDDMIGRR
jgi:hypothetical protein